MPFQDKIFSFYNIFGCHIKDCNTEGVDALIKERPLLVKLFFRGNLVDLKKPFEIGDNFDNAYR